MARAERRTHVSTEMYTFDAGDRAPVWLLDSVPIRKGSTPTVIRFQYPVDVILSSNGTWWVLPAGETDHDDAEYGKRGPLVGFEGGDGGDGVAVLAGGDDSVAVCGEFSLFPANPVIADYLSRH